MAVRLERTIWPVGHGAFYTEQFKDGDNVLFTAVYDCGSEQEKVLEKCIKEFLPEEETLIINALFISHFHADHVNKLSYLLQKNVSVRNLFIPQLTDDYVLSVLATSSSVNRVNSSIRLLQQLYNGEEIENVGKIFEVPQVNSDYLPSEQYSVDDPEIVGRNHLVSPMKLPYPNGTNSFWVYMPCNIFEPYPQLVSAFKKSGYGLNDRVNMERVFADLYAGKWQVIQNIYRAVFPNGHNEYSMTLYSGLANGTAIHGITATHYAIPFGNYGAGVKTDENSIDSILCEDLGCLYTGDFEAKLHSFTLYGFYGNNNVWSKIRMLQIPHHGSRNNYDDQLYDFSKVAFASTAMRDRYGHPHIQTLTKIAGKNCPIVVVQDNKATAFVVMYDINIL